MKPAARLRLAQLLFASENRIAENITTAWEAKPDDVRQWWLDHAERLDKALGR